MPGRIQQLSQTLINKIAAGEVIERPASVVKELVENSLDADSTRIEIEIEDGGLSLIRIIDDGSGIPPTDLPLAFAPHATSKLKSDEDLFAIGTMGFRGEALASIGSVSHARILSRTPESDAAYEIFDKGGAISDPQAAAGNIGTTIEVRNLFFNTPGRRKFLKGPSTEFSHISEMAMRIAIAHPEISFKLSHNNRSALDLPACSEQERWLAAWPSEFTEQRLDIQARDAELLLRGIIGLPEMARPTAKWQYFFLNGRSIRDRVLQHALREAYRGLTEPGRQPAAILLIDMPAADVDVNVHPTKAEVRFKDSGRMHSLILSALREKLLGADLTPRAVPHSTTPLTEERRHLQEQLAAFFKQPPASTGGGTSGSGEPSRTVPLQNSFPSLTPSTPAPGNPGEGWGEGILTPPLNSPNHALQPPHQIHRTSSDPSDLASQASTSSLPASPSRPIAFSPSSIPAIQLHNSYLVAESDDGLIIIDQHALHERIMFEELSARLSRGPLESQRMLLPITLPASARQIDLLDQIKPLLIRLGIELEQIGPSAIAIHAFPSFLSKLDPAAFVTELLERGEAELLDLTQEEMLHEVLDMMACKAAVKAGDPLTPAEIEALLAKRNLIDRSSNCPHGRPTTLRLSLRDLEKQFKRTGF
ncbi:MAG TPA: DNA mismatch repair endonuclease MutL [Tepidisphaeraceae bacterium]|jgi:DNA mismatch repair protein MutL